MAKLPVADFLTARLKEYDSTFEVRKGTGFAQLFINPMQFLMQPMVDEAAELVIAQSFLRILQQPDPDTFSEEAVDSLASNFYVTRNPGAVSGGIARVYYSATVDREWPANGTIFTGENNKIYTNPAVFSITAAAMSVNIENGSYYYDIPVISEELGEDTELAIAGLVSLDNDPDVLTVANLVAFTGGSSKETNKELIERVRKSIAVRDLVTGKGFSSIMFENFVGTLTELQAIGFGDVEMMRDIVYNTHIGGKIDGYFKTNKILPGYKTFAGLLPDFTRQAYGSTNLQMFYLLAAGVPDGNFDVSNSKRPIVAQVKPATIAKYKTTIDLSSPINLTTNNRVKLIVDGTQREVSLAGAIASTTTKSEIINHINAAFGYSLIFSVGPYMELRSRVKGSASTITIQDPDIGTSALANVFGLSSSSVFYGDGPIVFTETTHYTINTLQGTITRVLGTGIVAEQNTGSVTTDSNIFTDPTTGIFAAVAVNDIVTFNPLSGHDDELHGDPVTLLKDYRVIAVTDDNTLVFDEEVPYTKADVNYWIKRTGIKHREVVYIQYWFNPLSIDIGPYVILDEYKTRGVRPGRIDMTITDMAFLRITKIEVVDPITFEPIGEILQSGGGYGEGGYGEGPYGIGSSSDYYVVVNSPHERFSTFEDSYIVLHPSLVGLSFRVDYDYVPECVTYHNFVRSEAERVLDGDILMKHFLPAYVSGTIQYRVDANDSTIPTNDALTLNLKEFINTQKAGANLEISEVYQYLARATDPYDRYGTYIKPFTLTALIHNADGSTTVISSGDTLIVPTLSPFPKETTKPLSPRITHWVADNLVLERIT
jgi:hypothetical protein